ncbi:MAG: hypothetical protein OEV94_02215 [Deltaproteobacteria bacterium]|nr:hypothetical protein [Deltaproteobacteria bacterium]
MVMAGRGNSFSGDGLHPDALFTFFDDKGVWLLEHPLYAGSWKEVAKTYYWFSHPDFIIEDLLLMVSLYVIRDEKIRSMARELLKCEDIDKWGGSGTDKTMSIDLAGLYLSNMESLRGNWIKLVAIFLGSSTFRIGGVDVGDDTIREFIQFVRELDLRNVEVLTPMFVREEGSMDGAMREWEAGAPPAAKQKATRPKRKKKEKEAKKETKQELVFDTSKWPEHSRQNTRDFFDNPVCISSMVPMKHETYQKWGEISVLDVLDRKYRVHVIMPVDHEPKMYEYQTIEDMMDDGWVVD